MRRGKRNTGDQWDVKGQDVPGGRFSRSLVMGLISASIDERKAEKKRRRQALNRIRAHARNAEDLRDREALWALIPRIGFGGFPTWDEIVAAVREVDFLALAHRGELHAETNARRDRDAENSERRTCAHSVDEYLPWQDDTDFAEETKATAASALRRMLKVADGHGERYAVRRIASLVRSDGTRVLDTLATSGIKGGRVSRRTRQKNRKILRAWLAWELQREKERAEEHHRPPVYSTNIFDERNSGYSSPIKDASATVDDSDTRRFYPEEMTALFGAATVAWKFILTVMRCLGLRPGEFIHLRWIEDVRPLVDGDGYEIRVEGGRGRDLRCKCRQCVSEKGWAPKNGPRRYVLDRRWDERAWITPAIDALDSWASMRGIKRGDFLFPDPDNHHKAWSSNKVNAALHELGELAGVPTGMSKRGSRTFHSLGHTCASELLEIGIDHAHAAYWIGDTLREFERTYGRPTPEAMARSIFAPSSVQKSAPRHKAAAS